jgi:hypothetical protein
MQTIEGLKAAQRATHRIADPKKARTEFDRLARLIADAKHQATYEAAQAEGRAEAAARQADIDLRKERLASFNTVEASIVDMRKESDGIRDDERRLEARIAKMVAAFPQIGRTLQGIDPEPDFYGKCASDWNSALAVFIAYHRSGKSTHQQESMVVTPMDDAISRAASRISYIKKQTKLPQ